MTQPAPVLLIHGLLGLLNEVVPAFADAGMIAPAPDLPGYGAERDADPAGISLPGAVEWLGEWMDARSLGPVHLVGHSVGGAIAALFAARWPDRVLSVVSVEGNFTLRDAFWTSEVARMTEAEAIAMLDGFQADPSGWLARSGIAATDDALGAARRVLASQPASTLRHMAQSTIAVTSAPEYLLAVRETLERGIAWHLIGGERSRAGWDVPDWMLRGAASHTVVARTGHMLQMENPEGFARAVGKAILG